MTNIERIHAGQAGIEKLQTGLDAMHGALARAEEAAVAAEQVSHTFRRILMIVAVVGLIGIVLTILRRRAADADVEPDTDSR